MELRQLRQLIVLSETLNFHRAAERLHIAQPPLSTSIRKLEEELGAQFFDRLPSGLRITPAGEVVLKNAKRALFYAEEARRSAREGSDGERGVLSIGFVGSATYTVLPLLIRTFRQRYPRVELEMQESTSTELLRQIENHMLDIALIRSPILIPTTAVVTMLQSDVLLLAVSVDSPLARMAEVTIQTAAAFPFIGYSRAHVPSMHVLTQQVFQDAGVEPHVAQQAIQVQTILALVESGLGFALVPAAAGRYAGDGIRLVSCLGVTDRYKVGLSMALLPDALSPVGQNFLRVAESAALSLGSVPSSRPAS